jgi:hypothetical protein
MERRDLDAVVLALMDDRIHLIRHENEVARGRDLRSHHLEAHRDGHAEGGRDLYATSSIFDARGTPTCRTWPASDPLRPRLAWTLGSAAEAAVSLGVSTPALCRCWGARQEAREAELGSGGLCP